jgi:RNA polymerase sigma factor (sigma-70 family)
MTADPGLDELYRELAPGFRRYALSRDLVVEDADDVVQQVMLKLHLHWPKVSAMCPEQRRAYAWTSLKRAVASVWRRRRREETFRRLLGRERPPLDLDAEPAGSTPAGAEALRLIQTLSKRQYQVMNLLGRGLTPEEIAAELGMSVSAVHSQTHNARKALKKKREATKGQRP